MMKKNLKIMVPLFAAVLVFGYLFFVPENFISLLFEEPEISSAQTDSEEKPESSFYILPYSLRVGEELYMKFCQICHGSTGDGKGFNAYILPVKPRNFTEKDYMNALSDNRLAETIREGGGGVNKSVLMPVWGNTFSTLEINYLLQYIKTFAQNETKEEPVSLLR